MRGEVKLWFYSADRVNDTASWAGVILKSYCLATIFKNVVIKKPWRLCHMVHDIFFMWYRNVEFSKVSSFFALINTEPSLTEAIQHCESPG